MDFMDGKFGYNPRKELRELKLKRILIIIFNLFVEVNQSGNYKNNNKNDIYN
jgi:hypothetical protein